MIYPAIEGKCRMKLLFCSFIPAALQYRFAKSIMHISMLLWIHLGENRTKHYFNRTRNQSNTHRAGVPRRRARRRVAGGQMGEALGWSALSAFHSPSLSHGGAMLVGIESWAGYIKSFIHHTYYFASVSGQSLINTLSFIQLFVLSRYFMVIGEGWVPACGAPF